MHLKTHEEYAMDIYDPIKAYWREIGGFEPLSREREVALFNRARAGDEQAIQAIVAANLRFVVCIAREYKGNGLSLPELISEGNFGLMKAVRRFDETRGFKFVTYAVWWIRQSILKALSECRKAARPPMSQVNDLHKIENKDSALAQKLSRFPSADELACEADLSRARIANALELRRKDLSFDDPLHHDGDDEPFASLFVDPDQDIEQELEDIELRKMMRDCISRLDEREQKILRAYYGLGGNEPMTLEQIGTTLGLTRERIRQLRDRALRKLRAKHVLADFI